VQESMPNPDTSQTAKTKSRPELEPALTDAAGAAAMLNLSVSMFHRLYSSGRVGFKKIKLSSKCCRYSVQEIRAYCRAGCPSREQWLRPGGGSK